MELKAMRKRYYGSRKRFLHAAYVNNKRLTSADVHNIENNTGLGCMAGVKRFEEYLEMNGLELVIQPSK